MKVTFETTSETKGNQTYKTSKAVCDKLSDLYHNEDNFEAFAQAMYDGVQSGEIIEVGNTINDSVYVAIRPIEYYNPLYEIRHFQKVDWRTGERFTDSGYYLKTAPPFFAIPPRR